MPAECSPPAMQFARLDGRAVVADFGGGAMTSDAGALLLGATDRAIGLVDRFAACFSDGRAASRVVHDVSTLGETMQPGSVGLIEDADDDDGETVNVEIANARVITPRGAEFGPLSITTGQATGTINAPASTKTPLPNVNMRIENTSGSERGGCRPTTTPRTTSGSDSPPGGRRRCARHGRGGGPGDAAGRLVEALSRAFSPFACTLPECHTPRSTTSRRKSRRPHRRSLPDAREGSG